MMKDLEPYVTYYKDNKFQSEALDFYQSRMQSLPNESIMKALPSKLEEELKDDKFQTHLFSPEFFSL